MFLKEKKIYVYKNLTHAWISFEIIIFLYAIKIN